MQTHHCRDLKLPEALPQLLPRIISVRQSLVSLKVHFSLPNLTQIKCKNSAKIELEMLASISMYHLILFSVQIIAKQVSK